MKNQNIINKIKKPWLKLWQIADKLSLTAGNFFRKLRKEMQKKSEENIINGVKMDEELIPRMRTISKAIEYIKENDSKTQLTQNALRRLVLTGELPCVKIGCKYLISLENLESYLAGGTVAPVLIVNNEPYIKRIEV